MLRNDDVEGEENDKEVNVTGAEVEKVCDAAQGEEWISCLSNCDSSVGVLPGEMSMSSSAPPGIASVKNTIILKRLSH